MQQNSPNFQGVPLALSFALTSKLLLAILTSLPFFARFAKFAGFARGPSCLLICIGLQVVVGDFDQFAIFARFAKFAKFAGFTRGPSCLLICIGLQVVVGEILPYLPFLLLCAFLDISHQQTREDVKLVLDLLLLLHFLEPSPFLAD